MKCERVTREGGKSYKRSCKIAGAGANVVSCRSEAFIRACKFLGLGGVALVVIRDMIVHVGWRGGLKAKTLTRLEQI